MSAGIQIALTLFLLVFVVLISYSVLRVPIRYWVRSWREKETGPLVWYQLISEGRTSNTANEISRQISVIKQLVSGLGQNGKYRRRNVISILVHKSEEDGLARIYIGANESFLNGNSIIDALAEGINCRAHQVVAPPEINSYGGVIARRAELRTGQVQERPDQVGNTISQIGNSDISGTVLITLDLMRSVSEGRRLKTWINADFSITQGKEDGNRYSADVQKKAQILVESGARATISAFADSGEQDHSRTLLQTTIGSMTTTPIDYRVDPLKMNETRGIGAILSVLLGLGLSVLFGMMGLNWGISLAVIVIIIGLCILSSSDKFYSSHIRKRIEGGEVVVPPFFYISARHFIVSVFRQYYKPDNDGDPSNNSRSAPPSHKYVIPLYASPILEFMSVPTSSVGKNVFADDVPRISVSNAMLLEDGIWLGKDGNWKNIYAPISDLSFGAFLAGSQGSGKTNYLQMMFMSVAHYCKHNPGKITPVWAESKGQGAYKTYQLIGGQNGNGQLIDATNPSPGFRLALEGRRLVDGASISEVIQNIDALVSAMQFAEGDGIRAESRQSLENSVRIAMLLSPEEIRAMSLDQLIDPNHPNVVRLAHIILKGDPFYDPSSALLNMAKGFSSILHNGSKLDDREKMLYDSITILSPQYKGNSRADQLFAPARNKLSNFFKAGAFWDHSENRIPVTISDIVNSFTPIVVNMGAYWDSQSNSFSSNFSTVTSEKLMKMYTYLMWNYIKSHCSGWQDQDKYIPLFFDEVKDISHDAQGDFPNVLEEGVKEGRSRGCGWFVATQYPSQLPLSARNAVMNLRTRVWFNVTLAGDVEMGYNSLTLGEQSQDFEFSPSHLSNIKDGMAFIVMKAPLGNTNTNTFTLTTPNAVSLMKYFSRYESISLAIRNYDKEGGTYTKDGDVPPKKITQYL